jgi:hypothetical protein
MDEELDSRADYGLLAFDQFVMVWLLMLSKYQDLLIPLLDRNTSTGKHRRLQKTTKDNGIRLRVGF